MCDLNNVWSTDFLSSEEGRNFLNAVVGKLFPVRDIRPNDITVTLDEENYITQMSIYTSTALEENESIQVQVNNLTNPNAVVQLTQPSAANGYSRCTLIAADSGVYEIVVRRLNAEGQVISSYTLYKTFSYSAEYTPVTDDADRLDLLESLALSGGGNASILAEDANAWDVFQGFITELPRSYDPRLILAITAIVLFLLDIAVRKFKFKWPHEIIRSYREKKLQK